MSYKALLVQEHDDGSFSKKIVQLPLSELDTNEVLVKVHYSALNYKDALSASGNKGVSKNYPHTPGIDASGVIERSSDARFQKGDKVIVTSFDLGMNTKGAFAQYISVPSHWVIPLPETLSLEEAAAIGTAGLTAAIGMHKLITNGLEKGQKILISGSTGAVGSFAVRLAYQLGFEVTAISSKVQKKSFLHQIGAKEVITPDELDKHDKKPLLKTQFDAALDVVGGDLLANILKQINPEGSAAICGLVGSPALNTTVFPFILRGINLLGINSAELPQKLRELLWKKLADNWKIDLSQIIHEHSMDELPELIDMMLDGKSSGRAVIKIDD